MIKRQNQVDKTLPERLSWLHPLLGLKVKDCFPNSHKEEFQLNSGAHLKLRKSLTLLLLGRRRHNGDQYKKVNKVIEVEMLHGHFWELFDLQNVFPPLFVVANRHSDYHYHD